jgi:adenylosuccinate synthase
MHKIVIIQGMQFGSEAKGSIAAGVAKNWEPDTVATAWGPNAGHTVRDGDLHFVSSMLATGSLYPSTRFILIGPGSVVDFKKLGDEVMLAGDRVRGKSLIIHPQAAYVKSEHAAMEHDLLRIGSTMKGTMEAAIAKMRREPWSVAAGVSGPIFSTLMARCESVGLSVAISDRLYDRALDDSEKLMVEGAQGFSLGLHGQFYPYCTSRDVSTAQLLADCRIPFPSLQEKVAVIGVMRTYPIRVANRRSPDGQEFTSGGCYEDQHELDWVNDLQRQPELTTVTKLPRRIFSFSFEQIREAARIMRPTMLSLTFCDYLETRPAFADNEGKVDSRVSSLIKGIEATIPFASIETVSYGPDLSDIYGVLNDEGHVDQHIFEF